MTDTQTIHEEPDGTSPYMVENIYNVPPGEDWLVYARKAGAKAATRIFVIGSTKITEDDSMRNKSIDDIKKLLESAYPEVKTAMVAEKVENGTTYIQFQPVPGRKG